MNLVTKKQKLLIRLTEKQLKVAKLKVKGLSIESIANALGTSKKGVQFHLTNIYEALDCHREGVGKPGTFLISEYKTALDDFKEDKNE